MVYHLTFPVAIVPFWSQSFLITDRKKRTNSLAPTFSKFDSSEYFILKVCKRRCLLWKSAPNELRDRIVRAAECVNNEMLATTGQETEYPLDVCAYWDYWRHTKLCEDQNLKMCRFLQYNVCVYIYIMFYCPLRPYIIYKTPWSRILLEKLLVTQLVKKFPFLWNSTVHKRLPLIPILSQMHPVHTFPPFFPNIHSNWTNCTFGLYPSSGILQKLSILMLSPIYA
jgi:hypothetical protein